MLNRVLIVIGIIALLVFAGCGKAPETELQSAKTALAAAESAGAAEYAPDLYQQAMDSLNAAEQVIAEQNSKFFVLRSYGKAAEMLKSAEALAQTAATEAQAEKDRVRQEVEAMFTTAQVVADSAAAALAKAPRGKGTAVDIKVMNVDLDAVKAGIAEARAEYDAGQYKSAQAKLEAAIQKGRKIISDIKAAWAKSTGISR